MTRINNAETFEDELVIFKKWCAAKNLKPYDSKSIELFFNEYEARELSSESQKYYEMLVFEISHNTPAKNVPTIIGMLDTLIESLK